MLKFVEEFQRDDSEDDQASREEPNVSEGCRKALIDDFFRAGIKPQSSAIKEVQKATPDIKIIPTLPPGTLYSPGLSGFSILRRIAAANISRYMIM